MLVVNVLVPLFAVIGCGWLAIRSGYLARETVAPAGQIVIRIALPAVIFLSLASAPRDQTFDLPFLLAYAVASLAVFGACFAAARFILRMTQPEAAVIALGVGMSNSSFLGFPIGQALLGPELTIRTFSHCLIVENLLILPIALLALTPSGAGGILRDVGRNPLLIALVAGVAVAWLGVPLPEQVQSALTLIARLSAPLALLVIGGMLASLPAQGKLGAIGLLLLGKLVLHPLAVVLAAQGLGAPDDLARAGVLFAAMPMITIFPLLAARAGQGQLAAAGLMAATLASFGTLPIVIHLLALGQP
jgi:malonate transporter and related proteins